MTKSETLSEILVQKLIERKEELGYTNAVIAEMTGVPESTVTKVFNGTNRSPTYETISPISRALGVSLDTAATSEDPQEAPAEEEKTEPKQKPKDERLVNYVIATSEARIRNKDKWIKILYATVLALVVIIIGWLAYDYTHPNIGMIRYAQAQILPRAEIMNGGGDGGRCTGNINNFAALFNC